MKLITFFSQFLAFFIASVFFCTTPHLVLADWDTDPTMPPAAYSVRVYDGVGGSCYSTPSSKPCNGKDVIIDYDKDHNQKVTFSVQFKDDGTYPASRLSDIQSARINFTRASDTPYFYLTYTDTGSPTLAISTGNYAPTMSTSAPSFDSNSSLLTLTFTLDFSKLLASSTQEYKYLANIQGYGTDIEGKTGSIGTLLGTADFNETDVCVNNAEDALDIWNGTASVVTANLTFSGISATGLGLAYESPYSSFNRTFSNSSAIAIPYTASANSFTVVSSTRGIYLTGINFFPFGTATTDTTTSTTNGRVGQSIIEGGKRIINNSICYSASDYSTIDIYAENNLPSPSVTFGTGDGDTVCNGSDCGSSDSENPLDWLSAVDTNHNSIISGTLLVTDINTYPKTDGNPDIDNKITDVEEVIIRIVDPGAAVVHGWARYYVNSSGIAVIDSGTLANNILEITGSRPSNKNSVVNDNLNLDLRINTTDLEGCEAINARFEVIAKDYYTSANLTSSFQTLFQNALISPSVLCPQLILRSITSGYTIPSINGYPDGMNVEFTWDDGGTVTETQLLYPNTLTRNNFIPIGKTIKIRSLKKGFYIAGADFSQYSGIGINGVIPETVRVGTALNFIPEGEYSPGTITIYYEDNPPIVHNSLGINDTVCVDSGCDGDDIAYHIDTNHNRIVSGSVMVLDVQNSPKREGNPELVNRLSDLASIEVKLVDHSSQTVKYSCTYTDNASGTRETTVSSAVFSQCAYNSVLSGTAMFLNYQLDLSKIPKGEVTAADLQIRATDFAGAVGTAPIATITLWNAKDVPVKLISINAGNYKISSDYEVAVTLPDTCDYDGITSYTVTSTSDGTKVSYFPYANYGGALKCVDFSFENISQGLYVGGSNFSNFFADDTYDSYEGDHKPKNPYLVGGLPAYYQTKYDGVSPFDGVDSNSAFIAQATNQLAEMYYEDSYPVADINSLRMGTTEGVTAISGTANNNLDLIIDLDSNKDGQIAGEITVYDRQSANAIRAGLPEINYRYNDTTASTPFASDLKTVSVGLNNSNRCVYTDSPTSSETPSISGSGIFNSCSYVASGTSLTISFVISPTVMSSCSDYLSNFTVQAEDFAGAVSSTVVAQNLDIWNGRDVCVYARYVNLDDHEDLDICTTGSNIDSSYFMPGNSNLTMAVAYNPEVARLTWPSVINWSNGAGYGQPYFYYIDGSGNTNYLETYDFYNITSYFIAGYYNPWALTDQCSVTVTQSNFQTYFSDGGYRLKNGKDANQSPMIITVREMPQSWFQVYDGNLFINDYLNMQLPFVLGDTNFVTNLSIVGSTSVPANTNGLFINNYYRFNDGLGDNFGYPNNYRANRVSEDATLPFSSYSLPSYEELLSEVDSPEEITESVKLSDIPGFNPGESGTIPSSRLLFIDGDLMIDRGVKVDKGKYLAIVVNGDVTIDGGVRKGDGADAVDLEGIFIVYGDLTIEDNRTPNYTDDYIGNQLLVQGSLIVSGDIINERSLGSANVSSPSLKISLRPDMITTMQDQGVLFNKDRLYLGEE